MDYDEPLEILCSDNEVSGLLKKKDSIHINPNYNPYSIGNKILGISTKSPSPTMNSNPNRPTNFFKPNSTPTNFTINVNKNCIVNNGPNATSDTGNGKGEKNTLINSGGNVMILDKRNSHTMNRSENHNQVWIEADGFEQPPRPPTDGRLGRVGELLRGKFGKSEGGVGGSMEEKVIAEI